jgi:DNA-binding GntR family transcriptional regulator
MILSEVLAPIPDGGGRRAAILAYDALLDSILSGQLRPGMVLSQVEIAKALNVSRTPIREAMRMLQESGFLTGDPNYRFKVVGFDPHDIEALYIKRITLESLGVAITTRAMTPELAARIEDIIVALEGHEGHTDFDQWLVLHRKLHEILVIESGPALVHELSQLELRCERYQSAFKGAHVPGWWQRGEAEHRAVFEAMRRKDVSKAAELYAKHLARTALELLAAIAPDHDTARVRQALSCAIKGNS